MTKTPKKKATIVERQSKSGIAKWAAEYQLGDVNALISTEIADKLEQAIVSDFSALITDALTEEVYMAATDRPGVLAAYVGGEYSNLTPHTIEATFTLKELAQYLTDPGWPNPGELEAWRDEIQTLLKTVEKALGKRSK